MFYLKEKKITRRFNYFKLQQSLSGGIVMTSDKQILRHGKTIKILTN